MPSTNMDVSECFNEIDYILSQDISKEDWSECVSKDTARLDMIVAYYLDKYGCDKFLDYGLGLGPQTNDTAREALDSIAKKGLVYHGQFRVITQIKNEVTYFKAERIGKHETMATSNEILSAPKKVSYSFNSPEYQN